MSLLARFINALSLSLLNKSMNFSHTDSNFWMEVYMCANIEIVVVIHKVFKHLSMTEKWDQTLSEDIKLTKSSKTAAMHPTVLARGCWEKKRGGKGNGAWHVDSGENPLGPLNGQLLKFNCLPVLAVWEIITCSREVNSLGYPEVACKKRLSARLATPACNEHSAKSFTTTSAITRRGPDVFQGTLQMTTSLRISTVSPISHSLTGKIESVWAL